MQIRTNQNPSRFLYIFTKQKQTEIVAHYPSVYRFALFSFQKMCTHDKCIQMCIDACSAHAPWVIVGAVVKVPVTSENWAL